MVEIVYLHGTSKDLKQSLSMWKSPESCVQTAIGIQISRTLTASNRRMLALLYKDGATEHPIQEIIFGTDVANVEVLR